MELDAIYTVKRKKVRKNIVVVCYLHNIIQKSAHKKRIFVVVMVFLWRKVSRNIL